MSGADIPPLPAAPEFCVTSRRNDSLGSRWRLFASLVVVSFGFALGFATFGAWMVLPYSALEMRSAGKCVAVGEELSAAERIALARNLRRALAKA